MTRKDLLNKITEFDLKTKSCYVQVFGFCSPIRCIGIGRKNVRLMDNNGYCWNAPITLEYSHQPEHTAFVDEFCSDLKDMPEWKPKPKASAKKAKKATPYKHEPSHIILSKGYGQGD